MWQRKTFIIQALLVMGVIERLLLRDNNIEDTQPFSSISMNISDLGTISLDDNPIQELNGFIKYSLKHLSVKNCLISSIPVFNQNASINGLSITNNPLQDISEIGTINNLSNLNLKECWDIEDLMPLQTIKSLKTLRISVYVENIKSLVLALKDNDNLDSIELEVKGEYTINHDEILKPIMDKISSILKK